MSEIILSTCLTKHILFEKKFKKIVCVCLCLCFQKNQNNQDENEGSQKNDSEKDSNKAHQYKV